MAWDSYRNMRNRNFSARTRYVIAGAVTVLVIGGISIAGNHTGKSQEQLSPLDDSQKAPTTTIAPVAPLRPNQELTHPEAESYTVDQLKAIFTQQNSGLTPDVYNKASQLAADWTRADTMGTGRENFPGFWPPGRFSPCCTTFTIQHQSAKTVPNHPELVDGLVFWTGVATTGEQLEQQQVHVYVDATTLKVVPSDNLPSDLRQLPKYGQFSNQSPEGTN